MNPIVSLFMLMGYIIEKVTVKSYKVWRNKCGQILKFEWRGYSVEEVVQYMFLFFIIFQRVSISV